MLKTWWLAARPKTLPASISPILLGSALAWSDDGLRLTVLVLALICAMALQIAVNFANDWSDARSGVDTPDRLGPQRIMHSGMATDGQMKLALIVVSLVALLSGLGIVWLSHWSLLVFGLASMLGVFAYSGGPYPLASHGLGEVTVFLFFGLLAVVGTYFAHTQALTLTSFGYAAVAGLISAAIMLVNNLRDIPTDAQANKRTLAVRLGDTATRQLYQWMLIAALVLHLLVSFPIGLWGVIPALLLAPLVVKRFKEVNRLQGRDLNQLLANTAKLELVYCLVTSVILVLPFVE
ncbi:1,4-dihydroxy-2-naphthoate polyprenyltransferase [Reinekea blandensis]|uniref:1,4-dihydroxy-2-naphthoate octaprenyltransferase n=1 Tax=Reinekea blandensis MED297 TaxID=314283 RepID=A4BIE2_9GAMM|nr:1,4-dihydroxy-2-naphthoate polyprenyltransferase [Reinekea blandensis]EAR08149.1 1,4-dihydroxy-2-naphthoate octaprenyltransferase [Reinekea sp. MED297] [Reinekea blandensis MED297]